MKEKTADEMFEELGYEKDSILFDKDIHEYKKKYKYEEKVFEIDFWLNDKEIGLSGGFVCESITIEELKAINKKCEELRLVMSEEEKMLLDRTIKEKVINFIKKYRDKPKYLKVPLWVYRKLIKRLGEGLVKIDYYTERLTYKGLYICETITIERIEEIEVL